MLEVIVLILPILLPIFAGAAVVRLGILAREDSHVLSLFLPILIWICARIWPGTILGGL